MSILDHREKSLFLTVFADPKNQDCLLSFLNSMLQPGSEIVKAQFNLNSETGVFRRDFSVIYIISGENAKGCPVEVSLTLGMGAKMIPPWRQSFLRMVLGNAVVEGHNERPLHLYGMMLMDEHHGLSPMYHDVSQLQLEKWEEEHGEFMEEQKFHVYALEKFQFKNPLVMQELWTTLLKDPHNKLINQHPQLPAPVKKAMDLLTKLS